MSSPPRSRRRCRSWTPSSTTPASCRPSGSKSVDGIELSFATNVTGPLLLALELMPSLRAAAPGRVVNVSSGGMYGAKLDADDLQLGAPRLRPGPLLRTHEALRGDPHRALPGAPRRRRRDLPLHAPRLGGYPRGPGLTAALPQGDGALPPRRAPRRGHLRVALLGARADREGRVSSGTTASRAPPTSFRTPRSLRRRVSASGPNATD